MRLIFVMLFYSLLPKLYAQTDSLITKECSLLLKGKVTDGETKESLPGASIYIKELNIGCITDQKGECFIQLCKGTYVMEISSFGFKTISKEVIVNESTRRIFILHSDTCVFESVEIIPQAFEPEESQPVSELKGKELDRSRGSSLGEALKAIPGVNALQTGPTVFKPVIQGMYGNRVLIMNNGVRQEGQQWGSEHAPEIDPFVASKLSVIKGAAGVKYGSDAIGGVILVDPADLRRKPGLAGEINLAGFSNNRQGVISGQLDYAFEKIEGLSLRAQGTLRRAGNSKTPDYYMKNTGFKEYNYSWAAGYTRKRAGIELYYSKFNSTIGIFSASHIGNLTDLQRAIESPVPLQSSGFTYDIERPYQQAEHELFKANAHYRFAKIGNIVLSLARQFNYRAEYDSHGPDSKSSDAPQVDFKITTRTANVNLEHNSIGAFKGDVGINFIHQGNTTSGTARSFIPNFESYAGAGYLIERWKKKRLELEAGVRYDYKWMKTYRFENNVLVSPDFTFSNFSGVVGAVYTLNPFWKMRSNFGTAFRPVAVNELFSDGLHHGSSRLEYGNKNLRSEYAYNYSLSFSYQYSKLYGEINAYNNYIKDYIFLGPGMVYSMSEMRMVPEYALTIRGAFPVFRYKQIDAMFTGIDASLNDSLSRNFIVSAKLSLLRSYNTKAKEHLILTPPASFEYGIKYSFSFSKKITDTYCMLSHLLVAKKNKVPFDQDILAPPPAYMLFNLETGCTIHINKQPYDITFSVYNILNHRYRDYMDRFRYFTDAVGRNFAVRLKVPFELIKSNKSN